MKIRQAISNRSKQVITFSLAAITMAATALMPAISDKHAQADTLFPQTGFSVWGPFEQYWNAHGGLAQFGLPRTSVYSAATGYDAQWFERALFTYDPTKPNPYKVELNLLGTMITQKRSTEAPFLPAKAAATGQFFDATNHNLTDKFLAYWQSTGGLAIYGYPISEPFMEQSKSDGKMYLVQYFERNRFELHPELAGSKFEVQLGLLGSELLDAQGGPSSVVQKGAGKLYPPPASGVSVPGGGLVDSPNAGTPVPGDNTIPAAPALANISSPVLFSTDFANGDLSAWSNKGSYSANESTGASWSVDKGILHQSGVAGEEDASPDALLLTNAGSFSNVTLETYIYPTGGEAIGAVLRWTPQGYYTVRLYSAAPNSQPKAELLEITPTGGKVLAQSATYPGYTAKQWKLLRFSAQGSKLTVEIDGQMILEATNADLTAGSLGLYSYADGTAYFDNLRASGN